MKRWILCALFTLAVGATAPAHFVFVVPEPAGFQARVILSEDLTHDAGVDEDLVAHVSLVCRDSSGQETPLNAKKTGDSYFVDLEGRGTRVIHGSTSLGVMRRGDTKPFLLMYYPKTILGDAYDARTKVGDSAKVEIVALKRGRELQFQVLGKGKPLGDAEVNLVLPNGERKKVITDAEGNTAPMEATGRYGAWARFVEPIAGEQDGKKYAEVRNYATLVIDASPISVSATQPGIAHYPPLPQAASSFGAVASNGWLYVYGGHIVRTHKYSTASVSGKFHRLKLDGGTKWEELPGGPHLQGMNLATYRSKIYRFGGMEPRNGPDELEENFSLAEGACFDPATMKWEALPPMPEPRSSHDLAVVGSKLMAIGGWWMKGHDGIVWLKNAAVLDLAADELKWQSIPQPFQRRALIAAVHQGRLYVIGGFTETDEPKKQVDIYDPQSGRWTLGPELPGSDRNGFGPAACVHGGRLFVSVADGSLLRLNEAGTAWEKIAATTPRIVHRLVPFGPEVLVIGGAANRDNLDLIEAVTVGPLAANADATTQRRTR